MTIQTDSDGAPSGTVHATLTNPSDVPSTVTADDEMVFAAASAATLAADTTYWLVVGVASGSCLKAAFTLSDDEDDASASGWSIGDSVMVFYNLTNSWMGYSDPYYSFRMKVRAS